MSENTSENITERDARCLCGAVRFRARLKTDEIGVCHCGMCRRWSGGILMVIEFVDELQFDAEEALGIYTSSDWGERGFCTACGSSLFWRMRGGGHGVVSVQAFDAFGEARLTHEIFIDEKPDYYNFAESTHKMTGAEIFAMYAPKAN